jgi:DNA-binding NtrC family response regulator
MVAATNRDLREEVAAGRFRKDLFYRIHGVRVVIPSLRERPEDIPLLVEHFSRMLPVPRRFTAAALKAMTVHDWPGNVRELHFAVERAGLLADGEMIDVGDLPPEIVERSGRRPALAAPAPASAQPPPAGANGEDEDDLSPNEAIDVERVRTALEQARWRRGRAAEILGVSPRTLYRWMKRLGL